MSAAILRYRTWIVLLVFLEAGTIGLPGQEKNSSIHESIYLIAGTPTNFGPESYSVNLLRVTKDGAIQVVRNIVPESSGLYSVQDDLDGTFAVASPHIIPKKLDIVHSIMPNVNDEVTFNPNAADVINDKTTVVDTASGPAELFQLSASDSDESRHLIRVNLNQSNKKDRVSDGSPLDYVSLRYSGVPGGPAFTFTLIGNVFGDTITIDSGSKKIAVDHIPAKLRQDLDGKTVAILGANERFLLFSIATKLDSLGSSDSREVFVHDRRQDTWKKLRQPGNQSRTRLLDIWMVTIEQQHHGNETAPPEKDDPRVVGQDASTRGDYIAYQESISFIPGILILDNLLDSREIVLNTGKEDSEVVFIAGNEVFYRIDDTLYRANIVGNKLSEPNQIAKGPQLRAVHWGFLAK